MSVKVISFPVLSGFESVLATEPLFSARPLFSTQNKVKMKQGKPLVLINLCD